MFRSLIIIAVIVILFLLIRTRVRNLQQHRHSNDSGNNGKSSGSGSAKDTVQCTFCNTYIPEKEAITSGEHSFCSKQHLHDWQKNND